MGEVEGIVILLLPVDFPFRSQLLAMTYGVVLFTLVVQGMTTKALVQWLNLIEPNQGLGTDQGPPDCRACLSARK